MTCITRKLAIIVGLLCCANQAFSMNSSEEEKHKKQQAKMKAYEKLGEEEQVLAEHIPALRNYEKEAIKVPFLISLAMFAVGGIGIGICGAYEYPSDPKIATSSVISCVCGLWGLIRSVPCAYKGYNNIRKLNKTQKNRECWIGIRWMCIEALENTTDLTSVDKNLINDPEYAGNYELAHSNGTAVPFDVNNVEKFKKILKHEYNSPMYTLKQKLENIGIPAQ